MVSPTMAKMSVLAMYVKVLQNLCPKQPEFMCYTKGKYHRNHMHTYSCIQGSTSGLMAVRS